MLCCGKIMFACCAMRMFNILIAIGAVQFFSERLFVNGAQEGIVFKVHSPFGNLSL